MFSTDSGILIANAILAIGTLVIAVFSVIQAKAAKRSADTAERAMKTCERADILLEAADVKLSMAGKLDGHGQVVLQFKNFGRTQARDLSFDTRLIIANTPDTEALRFFSPLWVQHKPSWWLSTGLSNA